MSAIINNYNKPIGYTIEFSDKDGIKYFGGYYTDRYTPLFFKNSPEIKTFNTLEQARQSFRHLINFWETSIYWKVCINNTQYNDSILFTSNPERNNSQNNNYNFTLRIKSPKEK